MKRIMKTLFLSFLMIVLGLSAATNSMNESTETTTLGEPSAPQEVILPANLLNEAGHHFENLFQKLVPAVEFKRRFDPF